MTVIDLNCDLGEGAPHDAALLDIVSSANIACGIHAGNRALMEMTVRMAAEKGVAIGAHPSLPEREGFGRGNIEAEYNDELADLLFCQVAIMKRFAQRCGKNLDHVKAHGTLYNQASLHPKIAAFLAKVMFGICPQAIVFSMAGSEMTSAARALGLRVAEEAFLDRAYQPNGHLVPRGAPGAVIDDVQFAVKRAVRLIKTGTVLSSDGNEITVRAQTFCIHGDTPQALDLARTLQAEFKKQDITIRKVTV